ncbi:MAG: hypothetical protein AB1646_11135 [Thermodesulfobacteriota bacterium]
MSKRVLLVVSLIVSVTGVAHGQGILDSVFGSGGLGLWGGNNVAANTAQRFNGPEFYGAPRQPSEHAQLLAQAQQGQGYYPPQGMPEYQAYPPAQPGYQQYPGGQYAAPQTQQGYGAPMPPPQYPQGAPPQQYAPTPGYQPQYPQGYQPPQPGAYGPAPGQYPPSQDQYQGQPEGPYTGPPPGYAAPPGAYPPPPGQYGPPAQQDDLNDLPSGAVRVTTQTPAGTTVQFYPPVGQPATAPGQSPSGQQGDRPRRLKAKANKPKAPTKKKPETRASSEESPSAQEGYVIAPRPVPIPQTRNPNWTGAVR